MPDPHATGSSPATNLIAKALRGTDGLLRREQADLVLERLDRAGYKIISKYEIHMPSGGEVYIDWEGDDA